MVRIGLLGLGKLGLPVAVTLASKFPVMGYDINPDLCKLRVYEHKELGPNLENNFQKWFDDACDLTNKKDKGLMFSPCLPGMVKNSDIIFVAVQTPHESRYDGSTLLPAYPDRKDFEYAYLVKAVKELANMVKPSHTVVIISTVLPGTVRTEILPILKPTGCKLIYNPFFIAMGTVMWDFLHPEFVLLGMEDGSGDDKSVDDVWSMYCQFYDSPMNFREMSYESAELTKVAYNLFISQKIMFANTLMEMSHKIPQCNVDDVTDALGTATNRLVSNKYLSGGMVDGGSCHPRDAIAMSYFADKLGMHYNPFEQIIISREKQTEWLMWLLDKYGYDYVKNKPMPKIILGKAFKPETAITAGSPAMLCADILREKYKDKHYYHYDPYIDGSNSGPVYMEPCAYLIACKHRTFQTYRFTPGSVVIDPFRYIPKQTDVKVISVGNPWNKE